MAKKNKSASQWEFGDLFDQPTTRQVLTVSQLTLRIRELLEEEIGLVWVSGEITNLRTQTSGHSYFTLKDAASQISCVLFRGEAAGSRGILQDGQKVLLHGQLTVYEPRGQYQLKVTDIELQGTGALQIAFEKLKLKLQSEGLFDSARKRPIPRYPSCLGIVTSPTGAALRDVLHVIERRHPALEILLAPCRVQGAGAAAEIATSIRRLNQWRDAQTSAAAAAAATATHPLLPTSPPAADDPAILFHLPFVPDLILVTRGGGNLEDLWSFNEEIVARAIFESSLPIVSAVGHEIDITISDFVADLRAATPSAAAEIITGPAIAAREMLPEVRAQLLRLATQGLRRSTDAAGQLMRRLQRSHPRRKLQEQSQQLDEILTALLRATRQTQKDICTRWATLAQRLRRSKPSTALLDRRKRMFDSTRRLSERLPIELSSRRAGFDRLADRLRLLSPTHVLQRGYSITTLSSSGQVVRDAQDVQEGQRLHTQLHSGAVESIAQARTFHT